MSVSASRLYWNETEPGTWQAVTANRLFEITLVRETGHEFYSVEMAEGERFPENLGEYKSLDQAQRTAQRAFAAGKVDRHDPLAAVLSRFHPERMGI